MTRKIAKIRYTISFIIGIHSSCIAMQPIQNNTLHKLPNEFFIEIGQWLPIKAVAAWGCTSKRFYKLFDTPHWTKKRAADNYAIPEHHALKYYGVNKKLMYLSKNSTIESYDAPTFDTLFKNPYADANYILRPEAPGNWQRHSISLIIAASRNLCIPLIYALVQKGADVNCTVGMDSAISCVINSNYLQNRKKYNFDAQKRTLHCLVELGANINYRRSDDGSNYLFYALQLKSSGECENAMKMIPTLLSCGINPNYCLPGTDLTPLSCLVCYHIPSKENTEALIALLKAGADEYPYLFQLLGTSLYEDTKYKPEWRTIMEEYGKKPQNTCTVL